MRTITILTICFLGLPVVFAAEPTTPPPVTMRNVRDSAETILERMAKGWRGDAEMRIEGDLRVGFRIAGDDGGDFTLLIGGDGCASLSRGIADPEPPILTADIDTLRRIDRGEISAMTAMAREKMRDKTPLDVVLPEGFRWDAATQATYLPFVFHFFNRNEPEVTRFGDGATRFVHGGNSSIFYYDSGVRTSWYQLEGGMHINEKESQKKNPFKSLFVITRGSVESKIGGIERTLFEGEAVVVPAGVPHEFRVAEKGYAEFVLVMFGDGA